jgi:ubiquinone/menaquinone biosynthesis C-methylase UbiE
MDSKGIETWELLQKKMVWEQLEFIHNKRVLDFGSGKGMTSNHFAIDNEVVAIEPSEWMLKDRFLENDYTQIQGDVKKLKNFEDGSFDVILCHNVLEYVGDRKEIIKEFSRLLKKKGYLSVLKHNRAGRVIQMVVLLNNFEHANELLAGKNGYTEKFGSINYYEDKELLEWSDKFELDRTLGVRTFWDLQQKQKIQKDITWQQQMLEIELKVSELEEYKSISSFHHVILRKK